MKIAIFVNSLGLGGTEKAACRWARGLHERGHEVWVLTLREGPRRAELELAGIEAQAVPASAAAIAEKLRLRRPDVIHAHAPGHRHEGDVLGEALALLPKIPVVQTNIFGRFENPAEDRWTDFRLFISWTSCVQAARRAFRPINETFFRRASVAVYPLDACEAAEPAEVQRFREQHGIRRDEILLGRLSRPDPNKWTELALDSFRCAAKKNVALKLLLREPPEDVRRRLERAPDKDRFVLLPATGHPDELRVTLSSLDIVLHTSSMGESFGYGIAEPMNIGKPVIANSTPWEDQAQIELARHGECGFIASTVTTMADAILRLSADENLRHGFGERARSHIRRLTEPAQSLNRLEAMLVAAIMGADNPHGREDLDRAKRVADYLDEQQFGHVWRDQAALRPRYWRARFHQWRRSRAFQFAVGASS
jgi:glycosyltransferase involved in cell wall biosynthesis